MLRWLDRSVSRLLSELRRLALVEQSHYRGKYAECCEDQVLTSYTSDYLNMERQFHDPSPNVNQSLYNPEWIYRVDPLLFLPDQKA